MILILKELIQNHNSYDILLLDISMPNYDISSEDSGGDWMPFAGKKILKEIDRYLKSDEKKTLKDIDKYLKGESKGKVKSAFYIPQKLKGKGKKERLDILGRRLDENKEDQAVEKNILDFYEKELDKDRESIMNINTIAKKYGIRLTPYKGLGIS